MTRRTRWRMIASWSVYLVPALTLVVLLAVGVLG